jgi:hypothetical protein
MPRISSRNSLATMDNSAATKRRHSGLANHRLCHQVSPPLSPMFSGRRTTPLSLRNSCQEVAALYEEELKNRRNVKRRDSTGNMLLERVVAPIAQILAEIPALSSRSSSFVQDYDTQRTQPSTHANSSEGSWISGKGNEMSEDLCSWGEFVDISEEEHYTKYCRVRKLVR